MTTTQTPTDNNIKTQYKQQQQKIFRLKQYQISVIPISERILTIKAIDYNLKIQFSESNLTLEQIGTSTIILALQGKNKIVTIQPNYKKQGQLEILQLHIIVESLFLKIIEQKIYLKKSHNINEAQLLQKKISSLSLKIKSIKLNKNLQNMKGYNLCNIKPEQQYFNGAGYQNLITLKLPKGMYILTFSFLLKANNTWIYLYINQGEALMLNSGYYVPIGSNWIPYTIKKTYKVEQDYKQVSFTTNSCSSYPITLRHRIMTAQPLKDQKYQ